VFLEISYEKSILKIFSASRKTEDWGRNRGRRRRQLGQIFVGAAICWIKQLQR